MIEVFQQHQAFWLLVFFVLFLVTAFYVVQGLKKIGAALFG